MFISFKTSPLLLSTLLIVACSSSDPTPEPRSNLVWRSCTDGAALECAELRVPRNYNTAADDEITIAINRLKASAQPASGVLLLNPGGPGASGKELLQVLSEFDSIPDSVRNKYDLIGFDPRGVGQSTPVDCREFGIDDLDHYVADRNDIDELVIAAGAAASECYGKYGDYLQQLGSLNVARDMDKIRESLNQGTINFLGYSYGTRLGALYLEHFPDKSGAFILDASMKPGPEVIPLIEGSLPQMQRNLENILLQCARVTAECVPQELHAQLISRISELSQLEENSEFELLGELIQLGAQEPAAGDFLVGPLVSYLQTGDAQVLQNFKNFAETQLGSPNEDGDDSVTAEVAVMCADDANRPTADTLEQTLSLFNQSSDIFAEATLHLAASCVGWPESIEPLSASNTSDAPASLVIGGINDAQTPTQWSEEMAAAIGGVYVQSLHDGHTVVFTGQSECIDSVAENFLIDNSLPEGTNCLLTK